MPISPSEASLLGETLQRYTRLGIKMSDQAAHISSRLGRDIVLKMPIGIVPVGEMREHTEMRAQANGFAIFRGSGRLPVVLLAVEVSDDEAKVVAGELQDYINL
jgi:hypothetical protein